MAANSAPPGMVTVPATVTLPTTVNIPINSAPTVTESAPAQPGVVATERGSATGRGAGVARPASRPCRPTTTQDDYRPAITPQQAGEIAAKRRAGELPSRDEVLAQGNRSFPTCGSTCTCTP